MKKLLLIALFLLFYILGISQNNMVQIDSWQFRKANTSDNLLPAVVPGTVHTDLYLNNLIPDPFLGCNHKELGWIDESDWEYRAKFDIPKQFDLNKPIYIIFEGIDTYSEIVLNDSLILTTDNMFREWSLDCGKILKPINNTLVVKFRSAIAYVKEQKTKLPYVIPGEEHAYIRKSPYHFGWDWGPRIVTCGIWKPVYLKQEQEINIVSSYIRTKSILDAKAELEVELDVYSKDDKSITLNIFDNDSKRKIHTRKIKIIRGNNNIKSSFQINNPKLWWPNGMGEQNLYSLLIKITNGWGSPAQILHTVGIRTIEVINEPDSIGESFYFRINNKPFFAKGANMIPLHSFLPEVTDSSWISIAEQARLSNINMLRIWGGGVYPPDVFFETCSKKGILIWQDFMFACSMYRWDKEFLSTVKEEATQQVKRIRQFPCIALWCGNNEVDEAWHNWGWNKLYKDISGASDSIWGGYQKIFHELLPGIVRKYDPNTFYWPSSPKFGWGRKESMTHGDSHYWGVWWGKEPFDKYKEKIPRFMSEYGYQGSPVFETVKKFSLNGESTPDFIEMKCHQKHPTGYETIEVYMKQENFYPKTLEEWIYLSQITQVIGYRTAIESQRMAMPYCMGSLYWQLNDCWPVVSWSGIDHLGRWKPVQYTIRDLYQPIIISPEVTKDYIKVKAINENQSKFNGDLIITLYKTDGEVVKEWSKKVDLSVNLPKEIFNEPCELPLLDSSLFFLHSTLTNQQGYLFEAFNFFVKVGNVSVEDPKISYTKDGNTLSLTCEKPAFYVQIAGKSGYLKLDNNYFHMIPGKKYYVKIMDGISAGAEIKSLWNFLHKP